MPFWFWNDRLTKDEIKRQLLAFKEKGIEGFVLHPRIGLPDDLPYLSDGFMEFVSFAVKQAKALGMHVILYDEGMYPSGSANGKVVETNRSFASRGLTLKTYDIDQIKQPIRLQDDDRLVAAFFVRPNDDGSIETQHVTCLYPLNTETMTLKNQELWIAERIQEGFFQRRNPNEWKVLLFIETYSSGTIRGLHDDQDDGEPDAPRSADLLNPEAVDCFIQFTYERYKEVVGEDFGDTIFAFFTDEPNILGRNAKSGLIPWTDGLEYEFYAVGHHVEDLIGLFYPFSNKEEMIRKNYQTVVHKRLEQSYYQPIYQWCEKNQLSLTGHPAESEDIGVLSNFHIPGQDVVWRWVAPEDGKGVTGAHSTAAKCAADAARHNGRRRNMNEFLGACGRDNDWDLSADDMKWYIDWLAVRGCNLFVPHAFYYSIDGKRSHERPPDVGLHNTWWPYYHSFSLYMKRLSWLLTDSINLSQIAIIAEPDHLPTDVAKMLYQHQIEWNYLDMNHFSKNEVMIDRDELVIQQQRYHMLIIDESIRAHIPTSVQTVLDQWSRQGGQIVQMSGEEQSVLPHATIVTNREEVLDKISEKREQLMSIQFHHHQPDVRVTSLHKDGHYFHLLVNEGEDMIDDYVWFQQTGKVEIWDAWYGVRKLPRYSREGSLHICLHRRESVIVYVNPFMEETASRVFHHRVHERNKLIPWQAPTQQSTEQNIWPYEQLFDWCECFDHFTGSFVYPFSFQLQRGEINQNEDIWVHLGEVHQLAEVTLNEHFVDVKMWAPYKIKLPVHLLQEGENHLEVKVTNHMTNQMDHKKRCSGLIGPVQLVFRTGR